MRCLESALKDFDQEGFNVAMAKIQTCIIRGEPMQAHTVLEEFMGNPLAAPITHETQIRDLGLNPQLSSMLEHAGYLNYGALANASRKELLRIANVTQASIVEINEVLRRLKPKQFSKIG